MNCKIESGNYEVVESNMVLMDSKSSDLTIHLTVGDQNVGDIIVLFPTIEDNSQRQFSMDIHDEKLIITCANFHNAMGTGTVNAVEIGKVNGKVLKMQLWVYMLGDMETRKVEYTIFKEG